MSEAYKTAKLMHGAVPTFDDDYMEKYIPNEIMKSMHETPSYVDNEGFTWGFGMVFAGLQNGTPYICLASKYMGQGYSEIKYIMPPSTETHKMHVCN